MTTNRTPPPETPVMDFPSLRRRLQDCLNKKQTMTKNDHHHNTKPIIYADLIEYCGTPQKPTSGQIAPQPWGCCYRINWTVHLWYSHGCRCFVSPLVFWGKSGLTLLSLCVCVCVCMCICLVGLLENPQHGCPNESEARTSGDHTQCPRTHANTHSLSTHNKNTVVMVRNCCRAELQVLETNAFVAAV